MPDGDRDRGILSPADRAYLRGETDFENDQSERNTRARIRGRVRDGVYDMDLLVNRLEERDRKLVFEKHVSADPDGVRALIAAVAFLYRGVEDAGLSFETILEEGISRAEAERNRAASVEFDVEREPLDATRLSQKLRRTESLTLSELAYLRESDDTSLDSLLDHYASDVGVEEAPEDGGVQSKVTNF